MSYYRQGPFRGSHGGQVTIGIPPVTPMLKWIMIAVGAVWLLQVFALLLFKSNAPTAWFGLTPRDVFHGMLWQPLTYMWLHDPRTLGHVGFNLLFLWMFSGDLERRWGSYGFLRYYLVCGVGAAPFIVAAGYIAGTTDTPMGAFDAAAVPTIGLSGALYGVILAYGLIFSERTVLLMMIIPVKARTFALIFFAIAFFSTLGQSASGVSHVAHLGGMVVGWLYLKRAWRVGEFYRELRWKMTRRKFRVIPPDDDDRWIH
jgi:membrane associated rhomboid family serine protease